MEASDSKKMPSIPSFSHKQVEEPVRDLCSPV